MNQSMKILPILAVAFVFLVTIAPAMADGSKKPDPVTIASKPFVKTPSPKEALENGLAEINKRFRERVPQAPGDMRFEIYFSVNKPNQAAVVINILPGTPERRFATFFLMGENGEWGMIEETFDR